MAWSRGGLVHGGAVLVAPQDGGQVEAEAADVVGGDPVAQAADNHLVDNRVVAVQGVSAAAEIVIVSLGGEEVVNIVVEALEGEEGPVLVALRRVVEDHVQVDLDPVFVAVLDEPLELVALPVVLQAGGVAGIGGEEADGVVAPVVVELLPVHQPGVLHLVELEDGHQLHGVDPQLL